VCTRTRACAHAEPRRLGSLQREEVAKLFSDTMAAYGKVDIVVNNAGAQAIGDSPASIPLRG